MTSGAVTYYSQIFLQSYIGTSYHLQCYTVQTVLHFIMLSTLFVSLLTTFLFSAVATTQFPPAIIKILSTRLIIHSSTHLSTYQVKSNITYTAHFVASQFHPSIHSLPNYPVQGHRGIKPFRGFIGQDSGFNLDRLPVYPWAPPSQFNVSKQYFIHSSMAPSLYLSNSMLFGHLYQCQVGVSY